MAAAAEPGARTWPGSGSPRLGSPAGSPVLGISGRTRPGSGPERTSRAIGSAAPGHSFRKVTLTKPTFCHLCSDFIWGLAGFLCDVCNFMSHEKCLKQVKTPCTSIAPSLVRVPVAHCFGSLGLYKRKFCVVCRKSLEVPAFRCEVCELHVHPDCVPFACSDCRQCHQDGQQDYHLRLSVHLDVYAPWYCLLRVCACCPETSARCTVSESLRPWSWSLVMGMMA